jgi:hypothetical protein
MNNMKACIFVDAILFIITGDFAPRDGKQTQNSKESTINMISATFSSCLK